MQLTSSPSGAMACDDHDVSPAPAIPAGRLVKRHVSGAAHLQYYLYTANQLKPDIPLFIAVHGIRRGARSQAQRFAPFIEAIGGILAAPNFQKSRFPDYQRLGRIGRGARADMALKRIVGDIAVKLGRPFPHLLMFGYSGGGQFVHRFALANPGIVERMAIAAPGWYTFPEPVRKFPLGIGRTQSLPDVIFDPARFLRIPTLVVVGEKDIQRDSNLKKTKKVVAEQGANRLDRGRRWVSAMTAAASRYQLSTPFLFEKLTGCGHSFAECMDIGKMGRMVADFLFHDFSSG